MKKILFAFALTGMFAGTAIAQNSTANAPQTKTTTAAHTAKKKDAKAPVKKEKPVEKDTKGKPAPTKPTEEA